MKNIMLKSVFFAVMALFLSVSSFAVSADKGIDTQTSNSEMAGMEEWPVNIVVTTVGGCEIQIVGNIGWNLSFTGTATLSGDEPCLNGVLEFGLAATDDNIVVSGDPEMVDFLNGEPGLAREIARELRLIE